MPSIFLYERLGGSNLTAYEEEVPLKDRDKDNEVRIEMTMVNGDEYFLPVPTSDFPEFVRHCQKLAAVLSC